MAQKRHTEEQIIKILKVGEAGIKIADICREHSISDATYYKWECFALKFANLIYVTKIENESHNQFME